MRTALTRKRRSLWLLTAGILAVAALLGTSRLHSSSRVGDRADEVAQAPSERETRLARKRFEASRWHAASSDGLLENSPYHGGAGVGPLAGAPDASIPIDALDDPELAAGMLEELMMSIREEEAGPSFVSPADTPHEIHVIDED